MTDQRTAPVSPSVPSPKPESTQKEGNYTDKESRSATKEAEREASKK